MKKILSLAAFLGVLFLLVFSFCAPQEMAANQNPLTDIPARLKQQGIPVIRVIPADQQSLTHIEIDLQSESTDENITFDDNWFIVLARREATLAYRRSSRLDSFKIIVYNKNGAEIYGTQTFLYPQDISQNLKAVQSKMDNFKTRDILLNDIKLENLTLKKFEVGSDVSEGNGGQIITLFVSGKDLESVNQSLPAFLESWSAMLETANSKYGTNIALCHLRIMDDKEAILVDEVRDVEIGFTQLKQVKGVKRMHASPAGDEENSPQTNYSYPPPGQTEDSSSKTTQTYPPPLP